jgi:cell division protein FtsW
MGYLLVTQISYARTRIDSHFDAIRDLTKANDHVQASVEAFLNGSLFGVGLGEGTQKFGRLPFPHTDSIFAVIGEELGLLGSMTVLVLFTLLVYRGFTIARRAPDLFGGLLASGVCLWIVYDAMLNIAVMTALLPPTGVPLPFISFGGSSLVSVMAGVGLVLSVSRQSHRQAAPERPRRGADFLFGVKNTPPQAVRPPAPAVTEARPEPTPEESDLDFHLSRGYGRGHISRISRRQRDS